MGAGKLQEEGWDPKALGERQGKCKESVRKSLGCSAPESTGQKREGESKRAASSYLPASDTQLRLVLPGA